jgi:CheY-like chemotaxis protein|tara:strand:- start:714 stop:1154 length:441 start_codon:yes stop_codon:yes gene_type:complete
MKDRPILLVEDNPDDEALTMRALKKCNVTNKIIVARDGAEALDRLFGTGEYKDRGAVNPAVVLLDLKLPKIDGLEVLRRVRENEGTKRVPVAVLTSSDEQEDMVRSYDLGANSYVRKPVLFERFSEAVSQLGLYWVLLNEPPPKTG